MDDPAFKPLTLLCGGRAARDFALVEVLALEGASDLTGAPVSAKPLVHVYEHRPSGRRLCVSLGNGLRCWDLETRREVPQAVAVGLLAG